jgi:hypothetical protein
VGGGHFLITKPTRGDRTNSATLIFFLGFFALPFLFSFFVDLYFVSNTEGHLTPTLNVSFWNQVVEAKLIYLSRACAFYFLVLEAHFFVLRRIHFWLLGGTAASYTRRA